MTSTKKKPRMTVRYRIVRDICENRGVPLSQAAKEMGISPPALQNSLRAPNPQVKTTGRLKAWMRDQLKEYVLPLKIKERVRAYVS